MTSLLDALLAAGLCLVVAGLIRRVSSLEEKLDEKLEEKLDEKLRERDKDGE